jgi:hypothetical protein
MIASIFITIFATAAGVLVPSLVRLAERGVRLKAPDAQLDYPVAWELDAGESIASSAWSVTPAAAGGLSVLPGSGVVDDLVTACIVTGGVYRRVYELTNTITTSEGRVLTATISIRIGPVEA